MLSKEAEAMDGDGSRRAAAHSTERTFRAAFDSAVGEMLIVTLAGQVLRANEALSALLGYEPGALDGVAIASITATNDVSLADWSGHPGSTDPAVVHTWLRHADGHAVPVELLIAPVPAAEGGHVGFLGQVLDVSGRKRSRDAAFTRAERFRALIENSNDVMLMHGPTGEIIYASPSVRRVLGYEPEELVGIPASDLVHPEDRDTTDDAYVALAQPGAMIHLHYRVRHRDGSYRSVDVTGNNLLHIESVGATVFNLRDITAYERSEEERRRFAAEQRALIEHAVFGIYRAAPDGRLLSVNPALVEMLGYSSEAELGAVNVATVFADPDDHASLLERRAKDDGVIRTEAKWTRRDGDTITVRLYGRPVPDQAGGIACYEMFVEDVSEQRTLEAQLRQSQKMDAIGQLAGGIAHDFNNLLTVILGEVEIALMEGGSDGPGEQAMRRVQKAAERASDLTGQLLAFSRKQLVVSSVFSLNDVVEGIGRMIRRLVEEDVELELRTASGLGLVEADRTQIEQILVNLVVNARDSMPTGGKLTIETSNIEISPADAAHRPGLSPGRYVMLSVSDTGVGMSDDVRAHIFEPFFTTKDAKGTGLGLATCYSIVKQHSGYIDVESERGAGTRINVLLPPAQAEAVPTPGRVTPAERTPSGSETILVVEDEAPVQQVITRMLVQAGYSVVAADGGEEALRILDDPDQPLDLVLTDVVLPGMGGREVAESVAARRPDVKVLFVSGHTDDVVLRRMVERHGTALLQKPFSYDQLASAIREALDAPPTADAVGS